MHVCTMVFSHTGIHRVGQALEPVADQHAHVPAPRFLISVRTRSQYLTLPVAVLPGPQSQHVPLAVHGHAQGQVDGPVGDLALADLHVDSVDEDHCVNRSPMAGRGYWLPEDGPLPDLSLYERLISDGITAADARNGPVDHVTANGWASGWPLGRSLRSSATLIGPRPPGSSTTASPAAPNSARSARISPPPATRSTALTPCSPGPVTGQVRPSSPQQDMARHPDIQGPEIAALADRDPDSQRVALILMPPPPSSP